MTDSARNTIPKHEILDKAYQLSRENFRYELDIDGGPSLKNDLSGDERNQLVSLIVEVYHIESRESRAKFKGRVRKIVDDAITARQNKNVLDDEVEAFLDDYEVSVPSM